MKYIDADKLIAEIKRLIDSYKSAKQFGDANMLRNLLSFIDTLTIEEPKQKVDLEKEIDDYMYPIQVWEVKEAPFTSLEKCARHFYELGLKARKEE